MRLTRKLRNELIREGQRYQRGYGGGVESFEIAEHIFGVVMADEERFGTEGEDAIEVSDYCYGIARFVTGGRDW